MIANAASLLIPFALTAGLGTTSPSPALHHDVQAYVTGYNTVAGQTDSTPCIAASGADICGRHDAVACPRHISLGTTVEIRGTTYVCEDRLAKKFDTRFDISCDKDTTCPPQVTGWTTIKVYDDKTTQAAQAVKIAAPPHAPPAPARVVRVAAVRRLAPRDRLAMKAVVRLASNAVSVIRGHRGPHSI